MDIFNVQKNVQNEKIQPIYFKKNGFEVFSYRVGGIF